MKPTPEEILKAFLEVLESMSAVAIHAQTGLPMKRCEEIEEIYEALK